ncbi:cytochrome P450 [Burkholderia glumae AU6208]|nr:cytochrome P450 [Burkholderia glumae AU6208]
MTATRSDDAWSGPLAEFLSDELLAGNFVDELVRYLSVNHAGLPRVATDDVLVGERLVGRAEGVLVMVNSGNRDESVYLGADRFDIHRRAREHVGFGHGFHNCRPTGVMRFGCALGPNPGVAWHGRSSCRHGVTPNRRRLDVYHPVRLRVGAWHHRHVLRRCASFIAKTVRGYRSGDAVRSDRPIRCRWSAARFASLLRYVAAIR